MREGREQGAPLTAAKGTAAGFQSNQDFSYNLQGRLGKEDLFWDSESHFITKKLRSNPDKQHQRLNVESLMGSVGVK